ncbi:50S ribosomal protein L29 [bacterium]|nr:50S ribosomal protein L29 [bacterium]
MKELKNKTPQEITKLIAEKKEVLRHFRFGSAGAKTKNVKLSRTTKKEIARMMTELSLRKNTIK